MWNIIQKRKYAYAFSLLVVALSVGAIGMWGLRLGIDFKGGTLMEVAFSEARPEQSALREKLGPLELQSQTLQFSEDKNVILRYLASDEEKNQAVLEVFRSFDSNIELVRTDFVGASVSEQLKRNAVTGVVLAIVAITLYIAWAFRGVSGVVTSWEYGLSAVIALAHDIIVTIGVFAVLGHFYGIEVGVAFIAALLTILGYSVNDTIVVYDRVRENLLRSSHKEDFEKLVNRSLNETLGRSFNTSFAIMMTLAAITVFGGETIRYFALAMLIGAFFGTFSSIFVASALLVTRFKMKTKKA